LITRFFLTLIFFFFTFNVFATNIRVLDFQKIIENNINISILYEQINKDQKSHKQKFEKEELNLQSELDRIEKLNLILEPAELEKEIAIYNVKLNNFNSQIEKFNLHYEIQINNLKNTIINTILEVLKEYSEDNKIDLVLDSKNYILSSNSINITDLIEAQVSSKKIEINFEKY
jgi:Skp family chaperone for outer membrane proteins